MNLPRPRLFAFSVLLLAALLRGGAAGGESLEESRRSLDEIQQRIRQTARSLEQKAAAEHSLLGDLETVERELSRIKGRIAGLQRRGETLEREIAAKQEEIERTRQAIVGLEGKVRQRLAALYKGGETGFLRVLFAAASPARMAEDHDFLGRIVRRDRELLADYRRQLQERERALQELTALRQEQRRVLAELQGDRQNQQQAQQLKSELLAKVRQDRASLAQALAELKDRAARLGALVKKLESEKSRPYTEKTGPFAARRGQLPWPADGPVRVGFGPRRHPELGTMVDSQGVEIAVSGEAPIRAVSAGRVIFANWFKGYGNLLILDHGDSYYTVYAQAARLLKKVGEQATPGETVALAGYEGAGGVYFEIRHGGTPLDPAAWLAPR